MVDQNKENDRKRAEVAAQQTRLYALLGIISLAGTVAAATGIYSQNFLVASVSILLVLALAAMSGAIEHAIRTPKGPFGYVVHAISIILIVALFGVVLLGFIIGWKTIAIQLPPQQYPRRSIDFDTHVANLQLPSGLPLGGEGNETAEFTSSMQALYEWIIKGSRPPSKSANRTNLWAISKPETFRGALRFAQFKGHAVVSGAKVIEGVAFLVHKEEGIKAASSVSMRQMPFKVRVKRDSTGKFLSADNDLHVIDATRDDELWLFLVVEGSDVANRGEFTTFIEVDQASQ